MNDFEPDWQPVRTAPRGVWLRTKRDGEAGENVCLLNHHVGVSSTFGILVNHSYHEWVERHTGVTTITHTTFLPPTHWSHLIHYCECLVFDDDTLQPHVALMRRRRPQLEEGKLHGVGQVVSSELSSEVMRDVFGGLTGVDVTAGRWHALAVIEGRGSTTHFVTARHSLARIRTGELSVTDEKITIRSVSVVLNDPTLSPTLRWLLPLALDDSVRKPIRVRDERG